MQELTLRKPMKHIRSGMPGSGTPGDKSQTLLVAVGLAGAAAAVAIVLDSFGIAAFELARSRTVPSEVGGLLLIAAGWLAWRRSADPAERDHRALWQITAALFVVLAVEQATTLHEWIQIWADVPWAVAFLPIVLAAVGAWTAVALRLRESSTVLKLWLLACGVWLVAQLPQAIGDVRGQGPIWAAIELAGCALFALALYSSLPASRRLGHEDMRYEIPARMHERVAAIDGRRLARWLAAAVIAFGVVGALVMVLFGEWEGDVTLADNPLQWFHLNQELTFAADFSGALLLAMAALALLAAHLRIGGGTLPWILMAGIVAFLGFDEIVDLHGRAQRATGLEAQVLLSPLVVIAAGVGTVILRRIWPIRTVRNLFIGGSAAWLLAQAIDPFTHPGSALTWPEEELEMAGSAMFVVGLLLLVQLAAEPGGEEGEFPSAGES